MEPYLKKFQTDQPMVPFIYTELKSMMKSLISLVIKPGVVDKCKTSHDLKDIDDERGKFTPQQRYGAGIW